MLTVVELSLQVGTAET